MDLAYSGTIKNLNSLAIPGRRASACSRQRNRSTGQSSAGEGSDGFAERRQREKHSLQDFENVLALHEKATQAAPMRRENGRTTRESSFTEEPTHRRSREVQRLLPSAKVSEGMSDITDRALQGKSREKMSEVAPNGQALRARPGSGTHGSRGTNEGWMTQERHSGFGYSLIKRTPSLDLRNSYEKSTVKDPMDEMAAAGWDRAFKKAREEGSIKSSSKSMLSVVCLNDLTGRETLRSSVNEQQTNDLTRPTTITSERRATPSELMGRQLDPLRAHQSLTVEAPKHLPALSAQWSVKAGKGQDSHAISMKEAPRKRSLFDVRRYMIANVNDESSLSPAAFRDDFPSCCKFPLHTCEEKNGSAGGKDGVKIRDFCRPNSDTENSEFSSHIAIQANRLTSSHWTNLPGSWRKRAREHIPRKSKSMTFPWRSASPKPTVTHRGLLGFYRSQSSDLQRFQSGHCSSTILADEYKYPEGDIPVGFGSPMPITISPTPFSRSSSGQARISEGTGEDNYDLTKESEEKRWRAGTRPSTGHEIETCCPAGEAKRLSTQNGMRKTSTSKGFDGTSSLKVSEECVADMTDSERDLNSTAGRCGNGTRSNFVSATASDSFEDGRGDFGLQGRELCLVRQHDRFREKCDGEGAAE
jgi:hypothetical protein